MIMKNEFTFNTFQIFKCKAVLGSGFANTLIATFFMI